MTTLKRQRPNLESDGRGQKRACSNRCPSILVQNEWTTKFQVSTAPPAHARLVVPKRCIHKIVTSCNLTQATCCACLDERSDSPKFARYSDGDSWIITAERWEYYCINCQDHWGNRSDLGWRHRQPLSPPQVKENVPDAIRITYGPDKVDITRSVDLTLDGLKAEVARLMRCDPTQLMVSDIAMYKGEVVPGISDDDALAANATHIRFICVTIADSKDIEMEDA